MPKDDDLHNGVFDRTFLLNPALEVPVPRLPGVPKEEFEYKNRKCLRLYMEKGDISARVLLVGDNTSGETKRSGLGGLLKSRKASEPKRTKLHVQTWKGSIGISLVRVFISQIRRIVN